MNYTRKALFCFVIIFILTSLMMICTAGENTTSPRRSGRSQEPQVLSPEVTPDRQVTFRILAPNAETVRLSGSDIPNAGQGVSMTKNVNGIWELTLGPLDSGAYRYNFNVDGVSVIDPRNPSTSESNMNTWSLVYIPGSDFMDTKKVPHGAVAEVTYYSESLECFRRMHVYTPPGYELGQGKYPVFYLLHGAMDCDDSWTTVGRAGFILDNLIAAGKAKSMIVVMPAGHTGPFTIGGPQTSVDSFIQDFQNDIRPYIGKNYRVLTDKNNRAIAGLSMGGSHTLIITNNNPGMFGYIGVFSSGPRENYRVSYDDTFKKQIAALKESGVELYYVGCGVDDTMAKRGADNLVASLKENDFNYKYSETPGGHTWINWRIYLSELAPLLFRENTAQEIQSVLQKEEITDGVTRIFTPNSMEKTTVNMYLVEGGEKALLIDTGYPGDITSEYVRTITNKPLIVVNTHAHPDHSGCNESFGEVYVHQADIEAAKRYSGSCELIPIKNGHIFDLGGKKLEVIETPGHTAGSICLLDASEKLLFSGDSSNVQVWMHISPLPLETYLKSMKRLLTRRDEYNKLLVGHGPVSPVSYITDLIACAEEILDGKVKPTIQPPAGENRTLDIRTSGSTHTFGQVTIRYNANNLRG